MQKCLSLKTSDKIIFLAEMSETSLLFKNPLVKVSLTRDASNTLVKKQNPLKNRHKKSPIYARCIHGLFKC